MSTSPIPAIPKTLRQFPGKVSTTIQKDNSFATRMQEMRPRLLRSRNNEENEGQKVCCNRPHAEACFTVQDAVKGGNKLWRRGVMCRRAEKMQNLLGLIRQWRTIKASYRRFYISRDPVIAGAEEKGKLFGEDHWKIPRTLSGNKEYTAFSSLQLDFL